MTAAGVGLFASVLCHVFAVSHTLHRRSGGVSDQVHIYIVRHGDKHSAYPPCTAEGEPLVSSWRPRRRGESEDGRPCYDARLMGDNPPITECGIRQAAYTSEWLQNQSRPFGGIQEVLSSPYTRTLQTALPLAHALGKSISVEYGLSEPYQAEGPFREFNGLEPGSTVPQLQSIHDVWNLDYGSPPIQTPETNGVYHVRMRRAVSTIKDRFLPKKGNLAIFTHATTAISLAYGLCYGETGDDEQLQRYIERQPPLAPAGVIHLVVEDGKCIFGLTTNAVSDAMRCGQTKPSKCDFANFPSWYWSHSGGAGPGNCSMGIIYRHFLTNLVAGAGSPQMVE